MTFANAFTDRAVEVLTAKYGKPARSVMKEMTNRTGGPYTARVYIWNEFDNGEGLILNAGEDEAGLMIGFSDSRVEPAAPKVDF